MSEIKHEPRRVRDLMPEKVMAREWKKLASAEVDEHDFDLDDEDPPFTVGQQIAAGHNRRIVIGQEEATLAATFIVWLGTNIGLCFLQRARALEDQLRNGAGIRICEGDGFLAAWAMHNARSIGMNGGWRTCEFMASEDWGRDKYAAPPIVTGAQLEILDNMARWLGTSDGVRFMERCEAMIFAEEKKLTPADLLKLAAAMPQVSK